MLEFLRFFVNLTKMYRLLKGRLFFTRCIMLLAAIALLAVGILNIYAVGNPVNADNDDTMLTNIWKKQLQFAAVGLAIFLAVNLIHHRRLGRISYLLFAIVLGMLIVVLIGKYHPLSFVPMINGTHRWITLQIAGRSLPAIQPSEFCKLIYIMALAWFLRYRNSCSRFTSLLGPFAITLIPVTLILLEPNLGTVMLMMPILFTMLYIAGAKTKHLLIIILLALLISPFMWPKINPYQRNRIASVFLQSQWVRQKAENHEKFSQILLGQKFSEARWRSGAGYHLIRSKYAIASGAATGYGYRNGPFIKYNFLPERHNDFIFAAIAHQFGFFGALALLGLYGIIIASGLKIAANNNDPFAQLLAVGIVAMFAVEVLVNVSMTMGLMPITGLTLPLISYGGSSLIVNMAAVGLLNNIGRSKPARVTFSNFG